MIQERVYRLVGGRRITASEVAEEMGISRKSAAERLRKSREPEVVLAPRRGWNPASGRKVYELDDGTRGTIPELTAMVPGLTEDGMRNRIDRWGMEAERILEGREAAKKRWGQAWRTTHRLQLPGSPDLDGVGA
ncbi:helix-turn-helix domain-containing protein [Thioalkalivibrio sp. ALE12]|uniref:helix-turn-helix domain-containing protein n=1 Tax=Thioalkalivibrio sp. ALE12 TaxID=1158170 RepID=UPI0003689CBE|nr:helix-turn-helix domain-containing protein [Thioalkalivibrio sp. ALE12]